MVDALCAFQSLGTGGGRVIVCSRRRYCRLPLLLRGRCTDLASVACARTTGNGQMGLTGWISRPHRRGLDQNPHLVGMMFVEVSLLNRVERDVEVSSTVL